MDNGFRSLHPFVIFLYYVLAIAMIMLYQQPFFFDLCMPSSRDF